MVQITDIVHDVTCRCNRCDSILGAEIDSRGDIDVDICESCLKEEKETSYDEGFVEGEAQ